MNRVAIIGAGHVGATTAYALMLRALFREIVLIDADHALAVAEAEDISDANTLARPGRIFAGGYADAAGAQVAILTAGAATHGSESRLSVAGRSAAIVSSCVGELIDAGFDGILIVLSNPVDLMALTAFRRAGLSPERVIGTGTLLDTCRLQQEIADRLGVASASVDGLVVGEHGDSEVVLFSSITVGGMPIDRYRADAAFDPCDLASDVRDAAYRILAGKGYTSFGVATAAVRICEAIVRDEKVILPVSTLMSGQMGIADLYLSLPCQLGRGGIERVLVPDMREQEVEAFLASAAAVCRAGSDLGLIEPSPESTTPSA